MAQLVAMMGLTVEANDTVVVHSVGVVVEEPSELLDLLHANKMVSNNSVLPMKSLFIWMYLAFQ